MSCAELALWARVEALQPEAIPSALWEQRTLVKTWAMRGTLHLLPSSELPIWHAALGTSRRFLKERAWKNYFGITLAELDRITDAIAEALDGRLLTREELIGKLAHLPGSKALASGWGTILRPAAFSGRLCFGPSLGPRVRFTSPDSWLGATPAAVAPDAAILEITRRFLSAYGPATPQDLARWWTGAGGVSTARQWVAALGEEAAEIDLEGAPAWMLAADSRKLRDLPPARSVRLLPGFDQYVIGASYHARHLLPGDLRAKVYRPQGWISPVLLVNGMMQGTWRHERKGSRVEVTIEPFVQLPAWVRKAAGNEAERLAKFLGGKLQFAC